MADFEFEQLLAQYNQTYKDAEEFGGDWMPDDGEYIVSITKSKKGVSTKKETPVMWWKLTGQIMDQVADSRLDGKEFTVAFLRSSAMGFVKSAAKALNKGEPVSSLEEASQLFDSAEGTICKVLVTTTQKNDSARPYTNCYIQEVIETTAVDEAPPM